jgi:hypothetical protein
LGGNAKGGRKMLFWKKLFGSKEVQGTQPAAVTPKRSQEACLALYVFNSDKISNDVSGAYGAYAEGEVLKALSKALEPDGGWTALPSLVQACHGDLFERSMLGETPAVRVFGNWLRAGTYGLDATNLESPVIGKFKSGQNLGYIPYVVGIGTVQKSHALRIHQELKARSIVGYIGLVTLDRAPFLANVASELYLPFDMEIRGSKCSGWLASSEAIREAGLER